MEVIVLSISPNDEVVWERTKNDVKMKSNHLVLEVYTTTYNPEKEKGFIDSIIYTSIKFLQLLFKKEHKVQPDYSNRDLDKVVTDIKCRISNVDDLVSIKELSLLNEKTIDDID